MSAIAGNTYETVIMDDLIKEAKPEAIGSASVEDANAEAEGTGKKELTRKEWKNLLRLYFTVRRPVVEGCGHKIDTERPPKNNCEICWFAWFNSHGEIVQSVVKADKRFVVQIFGEKFLKMFNKFMATVARMTAEGKLKEPDVSDNHNQD